MAFSKCVVLAILGIFALTVVLSTIGLVDEQLVETSIWLVGLVVGSYQLKSGYENAEKIKNSKSKE